MLWKILLLIAIIVAVLYGFKMISRSSSGAASPKRRKTRKSGRAGEADGQAVDLVKCPNCGAFIAPGSPCSNCGQ